MKKLVKGFLCCLSLLIALAGCDGFGDCPQFYFSDSFQAYIMFNPGTYWVYEDTTLNLHDSIYLVSSEKDFKKACDYQGNPTEQLRLVYSLASMSEDTITEHPVFCVASLGVFADNDIFGFYKDEDTSGGGYTFTALDSLEVNDSLYRNVRVFSASNEKYYWVDQTGMIRRDVILSEDGDSVAHYDLVRFYKN